MANGEGSTRFEHVWRGAKECEDEYHKYKRLYEEERHKNQELETTIKVLRGMLKEE